MNMTQLKGDKEVRTRLMDAAAELFLEKDFYSVSLREIAKRAETTSAMINYYFKSKHGLFEEMIKCEYGKILHLIMSNLDSDVAIDYVEIIRTMFRIYRENPGMPPFLLKSLSFQQGPGSQFLIDSFRFEKQVVKQRTDELKAQGVVKQEVESEIIRILLMCVTLLPAYMTPGMLTFCSEEEFEDFKDRFAVLVGGIIGATVYIDQPIPSNNPK